MARSEILKCNVGTRNNPEIDRIRLFDKNGVDVNVVALGINLSSVGDKRSAQHSLASLDKALNMIISIRAQFGAMQNRLSSVANNIATSRENIAGANSRIRDADMAEESTELTKSQILMQAGISVLGQANNNAKAALSLLGNGGSS